MGSVAHRLTEEEVEAYDSKLKDGMHVCTEVGTARERYQQAH